MNSMIPTYTMTPQRPLRPATHPAGGFTLVEVLIAGTLATIVGLALFQIIIQSQQMAESLTAQVEMNQEARQAFYMLGDGGMAGGNYVDGLHGKTNPGDVGVGINLGNYQLQVSNTGGDTIVSRALPALTVQCSAADTPVFLCAGAGNLTVQGFVAEITTAADTAASTLDDEIARFTVMDAYHLPRDGAELRHPQEELRHAYWTVFNNRLDP